MSEITANNAVSELLFISEIHIKDYSDEFHYLPITACPIKGQIHYPECAPCDGTCENPNPVCSKICEPGCACPKGQVIKDGRECVNKTECPPPGDIILYTVLSVKN